MLTFTYRYDKEVKEGHNS